MKIGIVGPIHEKGMKILQNEKFDIVEVNDIESSNLQKELQDVDGIVLRTAHLSNDVLKNCPNLKIVSRQMFVKEEVELDEMKEPFVVVDTADGDKVVGIASDEKGAKSIITTSQLPPMRIKDKKTLKIVKVKKKQMIGQPIKEEKVSMTPFGVSKSLVDAVSEVIAGKKPVSERKDIPEEILDDDVADFIGAASKAAQAGKKTFKFGDKEYPVTIKKDTAKNVAATMHEEKPTKKEEKEDKDKGKKEPVQIDPPIKEETK